MLVFVTGATGLIGGRVTQRLRERGDQVCALSRRPPAAERSAGEWVLGDLTLAGVWQARLTGADAVVHLAGLPLDGARWTAAYKERLRASRVDATRRLVEAVAATPAPQRPRVLVSASAVGIYGPRGEEPLTEEAAAGGDFLAVMARDWETEAGRARAAGLRVVTLRFAPVLSARGGALARLVPAFKLLLGGSLGRPDAWFPWIHEDDAAGLVLHALEQPIDGPVNAVAPEPVRMKDFARALGGALGRPAPWRVPQLALDLLLGEMARMINPGQRVEPARALATGYRFVYPRLAPALAAALQPSRRRTG